MSRKRSVRMLRSRDDYPMTSLSDGLGPQKDPNSGRTRVQSGPAGTHRPTTRRGSAIVPRAQAGAGHRRRGDRRRGDVGPSHRPGAPRVRARPELPLRATIPEGNTVGQHADVDVGPSHRAIASSAGAEGAGADPRRDGDDYPMTSLSAGLGPQKHPNSGRTRVESGPAGPHRPTTRRGSAIAQPSVPRAQAGDGGPRPET